MVEMRFSLVEIYTNLRIKVRWILIKVRNDMIKFYNLCFNVYP